MSSRTLAGPSYSSGPFADADSGRDGQPTNTTDNRRARFDNGNTRYEWDLDADARGDVRGRVGAGVRGEEGDVYVEADLNESTGRLGAEVRASRSLGGGVSLRASAAGEIFDENGFHPGVNEGELGAGYSNLDAELMVEGVVGHDDQGANYVSGEFRRGESESNRERATVSYHEREGLRADYRGDHRGERWETHESVSVRGEEVSATLRGAASTTLGGSELEGRGEVDSRGDWSASGSVENSVNGASLRANAGGRVHNGETLAPDWDHAELGAHYPLNATSAVDAVAGFDDERGVYARGDYERRGSASDNARASGSYSEREGLRADYRGAHSGENWETHETLRVRDRDVSGTLRGAASGTAGEMALEGRGEVDSHGDWSLSGNATSAGSGLRLRGSAGGAVHDGASFAPDVAEVEVGANYPLNATTTVDAVVGHDDERGVYAVGEYERSGSGADRARTRISYNGREGFEADYRGAHRGENWETHETLRVRGRDVSGDLRASGSTSVRNVELEGSGSVNSRGEWSASGSARDSVSGVSLRADASGAVTTSGAPELDRVEVGAHASLSPEVTVDGVVGRNDRDGAYARGDVSRRSEGGQSESVSGEYSREAGGSVLYRGEHRVNDALTLREEATLRGDGSGEASVSGDYRMEGGARLEGRAGIARGSDRSLEGNASYEFNRAGGLSHRGTVRHRGGEWEGDLSVARDTRGGGDSASVGFSERSGWRGSMNTSRRGTTLGGTWNTRLSAEEGEGRFVLGGEGGLSLRSSATLPVGGDASVRGGLEAFPRKRLVPGEGWQGDLRREALAAEEGATFVRYGGVGYVSGKAGGWVRAGGARLELGAKLGRRLEVEHIRLTDAPREGQRPTAKEVFSGVSAEVVSGLRPGESVTLTGEMTHAWNASVGAGTTVELTPGLDGSARAGINAMVTVSGRTRVEVVREQGERVRLVVTATDTKKVGGGLGAKISVGPKSEVLLGEYGVSAAGDAGPIAEVAQGVADSALSEFLRGGFSVEEDRSSGDRRLAEVSLDLSDARVRVAYDLAVEGDWRAIEALREEEHPGVRMERSIVTEMEVEGQPLALYLFGLSMARDTRETRRTSEVILPSGRYEVDSDLDVTAYRSSGWFSEDALSVEDFSRRVYPEAGQPLEGVKGSEHWLKWDSTNTDDYSSKEEVLAQMAVAFLACEPDQVATLNAYRERVEALPNERKFWVGPRNELRKTTVSTRVTISESGLDRFSGLDEAKAWDVLAQVWSVVHGPDSAPEWLSVEGREFLVWERDFRASYEPVGDLPADFLSAEAFVKNLVAACGEVGVEGRNDLIRSALAGYGGGVALGTVMQLAGRDHVEFMVNVDSNVGADEAEFDFVFNHRGAAFEVERRVFGTEL